MEPTLLKTLLKFKGLYLAMHKDPDGHNHLTVVEENPATNNMQIGAAVYSGGTYDNRDTDIKPIVSYEGRLWNVAPISDNELHSIAEKADDEFLINLGEAFERVTHFK